MTDALYGVCVIVNNSANDSSSDIANMQGEGVDDLPYLGLGRVNVAGGALLFEGIFFFQVHSTRVSGARDQRVSPHFCKGSTLKR
jgi:hypothetical protein